MGGQSILLISVFCKFSFLLKVITDDSTIYSSTRFWMLCARTVSAKQLDSTPFMQISHVLKPCEKHYLNIGEKYLKMVWLCVKLSLGIPLTVSFIQACPKC